jgi:hypothetical protein
MKQVFLVMLLAGSLVGSVQAGAKGPAVFIPITSTVVQDTNRWEIWQDNQGRFVTPRPGNLDGGYWPKYSGRNYIFGAGIWVGVVDSTRADTAVTWGYNPNSGQAEFAPSMPNGDTAEAITDSLARVYRSDIPRDTAQWPERDSSGLAIVASDQELWAICNDANPVYMVLPDSSIGIQVIRLSYAWNSPGPWGDIVKMEFEVKNITGRWMGNPHILRNMILGLCVDADIGYHAGERCYLDRTTGSPYPNFAVQYQIIQESGWGPPPYYLGMKFVSGPLNNTGDTLRIRSQSGSGYPEYDRNVPPGQPLGMTAFQISSQYLEPGTKGERYLTLSGRYIYDPTIYNAYQRDTLTYSDADRRFLMACGPFDLPNDSTVKLVAHIIGGRDSLDILHKAELLGVEAPPERVLPKVSTVALYPVSPNPSSGPWLIRYTLPEPSSVSLKIYDICGRLVKELDQGKRQAGSYTVRWDGRKGAGLSVPGGVYLYRLEAGGYSRTRSVVLLQ